MMFFDKNKVCICQSLPEGLPKTDFPARNFLHKIKTAAWGDTLSVCKKCEQHWLTDAKDGRHGSLGEEGRAMIKIYDISNWENHENTIPGRKTLLLNSRGGNTDKTCMWKDCQNLQVVGVAYCIDHLYEIGDKKIDLSKWFI